MSTPSTPEQAPAPQPDGTAVPQTDEAAGAPPAPWVTPTTAEPEVLAAMPVTAVPASGSGLPQQYPATNFRPLPPPPPGFIASRWPGPAFAGGPAAWAGALVGGVATAIALPLSRPGLGWLLIALVAAGAIYHASRYGPRSSTTAQRLTKVGWGLAALVLIGVGTFIAAGWLFAFCVLASFACASLALTNGHSVRAIAVGAVAAPLAAMRSIPWLARGASAWNKTRDRQGKTGRVVLAVVITVILLLVFGGLFASADAAFADLVSRIIPELDFRTFIRFTVYLVIGTLVTAGGIFIVLAPPNLAGLERPSTRRIGRIELALPLGALVLLFAAFVAVQVRVLFGGAAYVKGTTGLTYSQYAVKGFGQLLVVSALTLAVIGFASRWASRETRGDRVLLRVLLGGLAALSLVVVASATQRMYLYQEAYYYTRERVFFSGVELLLGAVFVLVLAAGVQLKAAWLPRAVVAVSVLMLLALAVVNPERFITEQNTNKLAKDNKIDVWYVRALSADAVPVLVKLPEPYRSCALTEISDYLKENPDQWYSWNLSRQQAREALVGVVIDHTACSKIRDNPSLYR